MINKFLLSKYASILPSKLINKKNLTDKRINFSNFKNNKNYFFQYSDIFYKKNLRRKK
tara:strand:- start:788 stop:961 length:174 start_codon:yes stop_codon:yes gene_type:complete